MEEMMSDKKTPYSQDRYQRMITASKEAVETDNNWLITLSDVMSLLLVIFIIFLAMSRVPARKKEVPVHQVQSASPARPASNQVTTDHLESVREEMKTRLSSLGLNDQVAVWTGDREIIIALTEKVTFPLGEAVMMEGSRPLLEAIADLIKEYPSFRVEIDGHTDDLPINTGKYPSNWELSTARAASVLKYLVNRHELDPARFSIKGNAEQKPLSPNWSPEQRARNRRVEIRLKEKGDDLFRRTTTYSSYLPKNPIKG
jgi:chemotaxis protein MotB